MADTFYGIGYAVGSPEPLMRLPIIDVIDVLMPYPCTLMVLVEQ